MTIPICFNGIVQKVQIISNSICYGPCPAPDDEAEQRLSISADGRVFFSAYTYGDGIKHHKSRTKNFKIAPDKASYIVTIIADYFSDDYDVEMATDVGDWETTLTNEEGVPYHFRGSLCSGCSKELDNCSDIIRFNLDMPELLVFDGCANLDRKEKETDFIFCNVRFDENGKTYCYLTDDDTLEVSDRVIVPVGQDNHEALAQIESIEYHSAEDAPFPLEKTKKILRSVKDKENNDGSDSIILSTDIVALVREPLSGISPDEWRNMLGEDFSDEALATALAGAWNQSGWLGHDLNDEDCTPDIEDTYNAWWALEKELVANIALHINRECKPPYVTLIEPFMERNGYRNGSGWWVKRQDD